MARKKYIAEVRQDAGYALRQLRRTPGFTAVAIATLALGVGATTAIFTIVDSVLLRPLRFPEPQRLTMIRPTSGSRLSAAYLHEWRLQGQSFQDMAGWQDVRANLSGRGEPLEVLVDRVTPNFFAVLGTPAFLGRTLTAGTDLSHVEPEVVLSHGFWERRYGGDPAVIGQPITLDGEILTIVGVMPEGFTIRTNELAESRAELWMPFPLVPGDRTGMGGSLNVVARLAPGVTLDQAQVELSLIARRIEQEHPSYSHDWGVNVVPLHEATVKDARLSLLLLFGAVGILLLIACANVANLVLSHAATRQTELAIRLSLGATAGRLVRQFLTENFVLAAVGGALGVVLAVWGTELLISALPAGLDLPRTREIGANVRILVFAGLVTVLTASLFGLVPSVSSARSASHSALRESTRGSSAGRNRNRVGSTLIVSEVALAVILLAAAGLLGRSFWELSRVHPGFQPEHVLTLRTTLPASKYDTDDRIRAFSSDLLKRIENLPGVRAVGFVDYLPMSRFGAGGPFRIEGRPEVRPEDQPGSWMSVVGGRYFEAMGIPLLRGRLPGDADTRNTAPVFIIDETLARRHWPGEDPVGTRLVWRTGEGERLSGEVVGVVGSVRWAGLAASPQATTYFWFPQNPGRQLTIVVRTLGDPSAVSRVIAAQVMDIDPNQPVAEIRAMQDLVSADLAQPRFTIVFLGSFAAAALLLASIGLYGVIAFGVTQRTREIGVRVALGAQHRDVLRLVMQRGMLLVGAGLAIGIIASLAMGRMVAGLLYGVTPTDPTTLLAVTLFLAAVAMLATYLPARRATRVDPILALKAD
jgi:putative ABC transport system permease protein